MNASQPRHGRFRRLRLESLERRNLLASTSTIDFEELDPADAYVSNQFGNSYVNYDFGGYRIDSTASNSAASLSGRWRVPQPGQTHYTGSNSMASVWAPVTITLSRTDGQVFSLNSIDLYPHLPVFNPVVTFTGLRANGSSATANVTLVGSTIRTYTLGSDFSDLQSLTWRFTGFEDYHSFDNIVVQAVPEPSSVLLCGFGVGLLLSQRSRSPQHVSRSPKRVGE